MNKKILGILVTVLAVSLMLTPLAIAKPGAPKTNEKFQYFQLAIDGAANTETGTQWFNPPGTDTETANTGHVRDREWDTVTITLTVGSDIYTHDGDPVTMSYYGTISTNTNYREKGNVVNVRVTETITIYVDSVEVGTLEIEVTDRSGAEGFGGTFRGHGTGVFEGVKVSGTDAIVVVPSFAITRTGTITGWPGLA